MKGPQCTYNNTIRIVLIIIVGGRDKRNAVFIMAEVTHDVAPLSKQRFLASHATYDSSMCVQNNHKSHAKRCWSWSKLRCRPHFCTVFFPLSAKSSGNPYLFIFTQMLRGKTSSEVGKRLYVGDGLVSQCFLIVICVLHQEFALLMWVCYCCW